MRVVRVQKIVLLACSLLTCAALMGLMSSTLPAIFFLWLYEYGFFSPEISQIMSEPIAQAWLFLILASFFAFLWKRWKFLLPLSGFFCAGLYLTRPAGFYGGVLLAAMFLWALYHGWRSYWLPCLIAVLLAAALVASPILYTYFTVGNLSPTPMYALAKIAFALQVAEPEDINRMPDEEAHRFLIKALEIKRVEDAKIEAVVRQGTHPYFTQVTANIYIVSTLAINEVLPEGSPTDKINLLARVSTPLLAHHRFEYYKLALNSFWYATTRLSIYYFSGIITICLVLALLLRGWAGFSAIALILTHLTHLWIVSLFDIPILRYIWATQFLILLSLFILLWSFINTWARNKSWSKQEINQ
jgi:MFS family permease